MFFSNTEYNRTVPVIIGTNVIRLLKQSSVDGFIPEEWQTAFSSLVDHTLPVKTTNNFSIRLGPGKVKTVHGLVRNTADLENAVTEQTDTLLSGNITICPRVVSLKSSSNVVRIPVRVCNLFALPVHIPPRSLLCSLTSVSIVDSWTPDLSHKQESKSNVSSLEDLDVQIDTDNLTPEDLGEA